MYRRFGLLYTIFSLLVLVVLLILAVVRINTIREFNVQEAETSFIRLQGRVREQLIENAGEESDLGSVIRGYAAEVPTVDAIVLYEPTRGLRYVWSSSVDILGFAGADLSEVRGFPEYEFSDIAYYKVSGPLDEAALPGLYLDGVYNVLTYADAYVPLRDSLIALVAFALLTVIIAVALTVSRQRSADEVPDPEGSESGVERPRPGAAASPPHADPVPARTVPSGARIPDIETLPPSDPVLEEVDLEEIATDPGEPGTLFNPKSGLSFREHLEKRLGLELERAAYNDQDLTCLLVQFPDARDGEERHNSRARQVLAAFKFEDLCFEYGVDSFCVILPNTELSRGIRDAEAFKGDHAGTMYFGLSARNGRLVEASRVLGEAERSLEHAAHEPGGIVGFRPDPRKYRQFVTQHLGPNE